ncbi:MAG: lamin tail domain-containing protein [Candidatus Hydrogenedentota bacterium]
MIKRTIFILGFLLLYPHLGYASTLRIVSPSDTDVFDTYGTIVDDSGMVDDYITLEVWVNALDTDINGVEIHLSYDPAILQLQDVGGDSFPADSPGIQIWEDHSQLGDILVNISSGDTIDYSSLTNADSIKLDVRVCTMLFKILSYTETTVIGWDFDEANNRVSRVTEADSGSNVLTAVDSGIITIQQNNTGDSHLLISEILYDGVGSPDEEYIEIYNPRNDTVILTNYYLSDAMDTYFSLPEDTPTVSSGDFIVRFPQSTFIAPRDTILIAINSSDFNTVYPGLHPDFEINQDGNSDNVSDMVIIESSGTISLSNTGEGVVMFYWNGVTDLVYDVDIVVFEDITYVPDKTGYSQDGPDIGTETSTYKTDDTSAYTLASNSATGQSQTRIDVNEDNETRLNGNGITGNDETTEKLSLSFNGTASPTPYHDDLIAYKTGDYSGYFTDGETSVEVLQFYLAPASFIDDTLVQLTLRNLGNMDDTDVDTVSLYIDADKSLTLSSPDTFLGYLTWNQGSSVWETTSASIYIPQSGETILVILDISDSVSNADTFRAQIDTWALRMTTSDSGPFVAITNANDLTAVVGQLLVSKNTDVPINYFIPGSTNITIASLYIRGSTSGDTLTKFTIRNIANLDTQYITAVKLYADADASYTYSAPDTFVALLLYDTFNLWFDTDTIQYPLAGAGSNFVVTIDVSISAIYERDSFVAQVVANECSGVIATPGPNTNVTNAYGQILVNPPGIATHPVISQVYPNDATGNNNGLFIELYNPTDTAVDISGWTIREDNNNLVFTIGNVTLQPGQYYLIGDRDYVTESDNSQWPAADTLTSTTIGWSVTNDGIYLADTTKRIIDAVGWGSPASSNNYESDPATAGNGVSIMRRSAYGATSTEMLIGGRRWVQGRGYDSFNNAYDFLSISDTTLIEPKNSSYRREFPDSWIVTVTKTADPGPATIYSNDTKVTVMAIGITGDTDNDNLTIFSVKNIGSADTQSISKVEVWKDNNLNNSWDSSDSFVAVLIYNASDTRWDTNTISFQFNGISDTFIVTVDATSTPDDNDTLQFSITVYTVDAIDAESGPAIAVTNNNYFSFSSLQPLQVSKNEEIDSSLVGRNDTNITVIAIRITSPVGPDTLTYFTILNLGNMDNGDVDTVTLWIDANSDSRWSSSDTFVANLSYTSPDTWSSVVDVYMSAGSMDFVVTISTSDTADFGDTFQAQIPINGCGASLADSGPLTTAVTSLGIITLDTYANISLLITEVIIDGNDAVEIYCLDDGNSGLGADISGWFINDMDGGVDKVIGDTDNNESKDTQVIIKTGEFLVIDGLTGTDESVAGPDGIISLHNAGNWVTDGDDQVVLYSPDTAIKDAVCFSTRGGSLASGEDNDMNTLFANNQWSPSYATENNCVNPINTSDFPADYSIARAWPPSDTANTRDEWSVDATPSTGAINTAENPITIPADVVMLDIADVPDDLGGNLIITWTPDTSYPDFDHYNIYVSTAAITDIRNSVIIPSSTQTDSSVGEYTASGLTNGDSYYAAVTIVDIYGHEDRVVTDTGPAAPIKNVVDTPIILITEIMAWNTGGYDTIELLVIYDGNPSGGLNLSGYRLYEDNYIKTFGNSTVHDSVYILVQLNVSATDDSDTSGDNILNVYSTEAGLTGTDESMFLFDPAGRIVDFVWWANRSGSVTSLEQSDIQMAIDSGAWKGLVRENNAVNPISGSSFPDSCSLTRRAGGAFDSDSYVDWVVDTTPTPGYASDVPEQAFTPPSPITNINAYDVILDQGSNILLKWDTVTISGFDHYNIYVSTAAFTNITNTDSVPFDTVDTYTQGWYRVYGLNPSLNYYFAVSAVNIYGAEDNNLSSTGPTSPIDNIPGTIKVIINEVAFNGGGGGFADDWIELFILDDGNNNQGCNLAGWYIGNNGHTSGSIFKAFGSNENASAIVDSGCYVLIHFNSSTIDEEDTMDGDADGVLEVYTTSSGLPGGGSTDDNLSLYGDSSAIEDFVCYGDTGTFSSGEDDDLQNYGINTGNWNDYAPAGADTTDLVFTLYIGSSQSIARIPNASDTDDKANWQIDSTPTPGALNQITVTYNVSGYVILEARAYGSDTGCTVWVTTGSETYIATTNAYGTFTITGVPANTYTLYAKESHHLRRIKLNVVVNSDTDIGLVGTLLAGDANNDNYINLLDGSIIKIGMSTGYRADADIDGDNDNDQSDLQWVRRNFGDIGQ